MFGLRRSLAQNWGEGLLLGGILTLAAFLRLVRLDLAVFESDEASVLTLARSFLETHQLPLVGGKSSIGNFNPPAGVYLIALPLLVSSNPAVATGLVALLNVLAVFLTYRFTKQYFSARAGLIAALLFAISFWAVVFSRRIWESSTAPLWSILLAGSLGSWIVQRRPWQLVWACLWLSLLLQFRYAAVAYVPFFLLVLALYWRRIRPLYLLLGIAVALVPALPFIYGQFKVDFADLRVLLALNAGAAAYDLSSLRYAVQLLSTEGFTTFFARSAVASLAEPPWLPWLRYSLAAAFGLSLLYQVFRLGRMGRRALAPENAPWLLLTLWFWVPVAFLMRHTSPIYLHYLLMMYPVQFIVIGVALSDGLGWFSGWKPPANWEPRRMQAMAGAAVAGFLLFQAIGQAHAFLLSLHWVDEGATTSTFGLPLKYTQTLVDTLSTMWQKDAAKTIVFAAPDDTLTHAISFLAKNKLPLSYFDPHHALVLPQNEKDAWYLFTSHNNRASQFISQQWPHAIKQRLPHPGAEDTSLIIQLTGNERTTLIKETPKPLNMTLENDIRLLAYNLPNQAQAGHDLTLAILWQVNTPPQPNTDYRWFAHLLDLKGLKWAQTDVIGYPTNQWQPGDTVLGWLDLKIPQETPLGLYHLHLGMYDLNTMDRIPVSTSKDAPPTDSIPLGPITVLPADPSILTQPPTLTHTSNTTFANTINLLAFQVNQSPNKDNQQTFTISLAWQSTSTIDQDYSVFIHLLNQQGQLVAQADGPPLDGTFPTSAWLPGLILTDTHTITLPKEKAQAISTIHLGLYSLSTLQRLPARFTTGQTTDTISIPKELWQ